MRFFHHEGFLSGQYHGQRIAGLFYRLVRHGVQAVSCGKVLQVLGDHVLVPEHLCKLQGPKGGLHEFCEEPHALLCLGHATQRTVFQHAIGGLLGEGHRAVGMAMCFRRIGVHQAVGRADQRLGPLVRRYRSVQRSLDTILRGRSVEMPARGSEKERERHGKGSESGAQVHVARSTRTSALGCTIRDLCLGHAGSGGGVHYIRGRSGGGPGLWRGYR